MAALEAGLIIVGVVFLLASFFLSEKLSPKEIEKLAGLTKDEMKQMVENEVERAKDRIVDTIDEQIEESVVKSSREMEKVTNDKIMSISEFSDTVIENISKNHSEVMFLYNMLSDKDTEFKEVLSAAEQSNVSLTEAIQTAQDTVYRLDQESERLEEAKKPAPITYTMSNNHFGLSDAQKAKINQVFGEDEETPSAEMQKEPEKSSVIKAEESEGRGVRMALMEQLSDQVTSTAYTNDSKNEAILKRYRKGRSVVQIAKELGLGQGEVKLVIDLYEGGKR